MFEAKDQIFTEIVFNEFFPVVLYCHVTCCPYIHLIIIIMVDQYNPVQK